MVSETIIEGVKQKEEGAFAELYEVCIPYVYTVTKRHVNNDSNIQDIIQEIFARIFLSISSFDSAKGAFKPWLRRVVINQCYQDYQKGKASMLYVPLEKASEIPNDPIDLNELSKQEIEALLQQMPEGYRQVFLLVVIEDYTHQEVAEVMNITKATSRSQLARAKKWLRRNNSHTIKSLADG